MKKVLLFVALFVLSCVVAQESAVTIAADFEMEFSGKLKDFVLATNSYVGWPINEPEKIPDNKWNWPKGQAGPKSDYSANWNRIQIKGVWFNPDNRRVIVAFPKILKTLDEKGGLKEVTLEFSKVKMQRVSLLGKTPTLNVDLWTAILPKEFKKFQFSMYSDAEKKGTQRWG